jgi:hypothetical protein
MAFSYGLYIRPHIFYTLIAVAIAGSLACSYLLWAKSSGFVKTCEDFSSQIDAQKAFMGDRRRFAGLDADKNGTACQNFNYKHV